MPDPLPASQSRRSRILLDLAWSGGFRRSSIRISDLATLVNSRTYGKREQAGADWRTYACCKNRPYRSKTSAAHWSLGFH